MPRKRIKKYTVAITGGIACGKSVASDYFRKQGFEVYSADTIAHNILNKKEIIKLLKNEFVNVLDKKGKIDRIKLGKIVFADKKKLNKLNLILHPMIINEIEIIKKNNRNKIIFFEIPLLFEARQEKEFDLVINIHCNKNIQIKRLKKRNNITIYEAEKRIASQLSQKIKIEASNINIENNTTLENFLHKLEDVKKNILEMIQ